MLRHLRQEACLNREMAAICLVRPQLKAKCCGCATIVRDGSYTTRLEDLHCSKQVAVTPWGERVCMANRWRNQGTPQLQTGRRLQINLHLAQNANVFF